MKPRNKFEKHIEKSASKLKELTEHQFNEAVKKYSPHIAKRDSKGKYTCMDCGHTWNGESKSKVVCPHCSSKLTLEKSMKRKYKEKSYFSVATTCNGYQVFRVFLLITELNKGEKALHYVHEVFQRWYAKNGRGAVRSLKRNLFSYYGYVDVWSLYSELEIRNCSYIHNEIYGNFVGSRRYIPELKRNGFDGKYYNCNPYRLVSALLSNNMCETAWKRGYKKAVIEALNRHEDIANYWVPLKIAMRHKYEIMDYRIWTDMIDFLKELKKDLHNPKLVCPDNLMTAHNDWMDKVNKVREKRKNEEDRKRRMSELQKISESGKDDEYQKNMGKFFELMFSDDEIVVKPLRSVMEFFEEGDKMHHCVYANKYYEKGDTLIMHAMINNNSIATIEFNLKTLKVIQCRGVCNSIPEEKERIIDLIQRNIPKIARICAA